MLNQAWSWDFALFQEKLITWFFFSWRGCSQKIILWCVELKGKTSLLQYWICTKYVSSASISQPSQGTGVWWFGEPKIGKRGRGEERREEKEERKGERRNCGWSCGWDSIFLGMEWKNWREKIGSLCHQNLPGKGIWRGGREAAMEVGNWPDKAGLHKRHASPPFCTDRIQNPLELWPE